MTEHKDWVIIIILISIVAYLVMLQWLQRKPAVKDFILQSREDAINVFPSWLIISLVNIALLSALISQYIPFIPKPIAEIDFLGYELNKFGYTFFVFSVFYLVKCFLSSIFYLLLGEGNHFLQMYFSASKFYFLLSFLLIALVFTNYYMPIDRYVFFPIILVTLGGIFLFKNLFYLLNKTPILPSKWYYKFLYICTLQFAPIFALWKSLFF